jgi:hypothetical protein
MAIRFDGISRDDLPHEIEDDGGILYAVQRASNGIVTGKVRVYGYVAIDGVMYKYDENFRVRLRRDE